MTPLVLSLFPGIGLLDMAFEAEGFCVVRGPDLLWGGDIKRFHPPPGKFDGVIGGPPCQAFSRLVHMVRQNGYRVAENLIPEFERCVNESKPDWFLMENVPEAPVPIPTGFAVEHFVLNNRWVGGEQRRVRRFSFGSCGLSLKRFIEFVPLETVNESLTVCAKGGYRQVPVKMLSGLKMKRSRFLDTATAGGLKEMCRLQGLPEDFLSHAPFTVTGKQSAIGNGVPLPMGRAIAKAVRQAISSYAG